jgi:hypothetical protein
MINTYIHAEDAVVGMVAIETLDDLMDSGKGEEG